MQRTLLRGATGVCTLVTGMVALTGCSNMVEAADEVAHKFSADSSLLGPASSTTYVVRGGLDGPETAGTVPPTDQTPGDDEASTPERAEDVLPATSGTLVISNGMITSAEFIVSVESPNDLRFVLTEPALYERHGEVLDSIKALGTLATQSAMYPDTRVTLTPQITEQGTIVDATFAVPESLIADTERTTTEITLSLFIEPIATFDGAGTNTDPSEHPSGESSEAQR